tara:strand:+ start:157 stop:597 length:441 start_codon:yes stop_codon:yes gene_type:complete
MKKVLLLFFLIAFPTKSYSYFVETEWTIVGFVGDLVWKNPNELIGKKQSIVKHNVKGPFYNCEYGMMWSYNKYTLPDLLANPEFDILKMHEDKLNLDDDLYFVHRLSCNGVAEGDVMMNFWPFIVSDKAKNAYYIMDQGVFIFEPE